MTQLANVVACKVLLRWVSDNYSRAKRVVSLMRVFSFVISVSLSQTFMQYLQSVGFQIWLPTRVCRLELNLARAAQFRRGSNLVPY